jgi:hypothetical protein
LHLYRRIDLGIGPGGQRSEIVPFGQVVTHVGSLRWQPPGTFWTV